jgi:phosphohistidine phosphatase
VASSAKRTVATAKRIAETCGFDDSIWTTRDLYLAPFDAYSSVIAESPQEIQTMLLIGHNPTVAHWLEQLTGEMHAVPTATIASIMMHLDHWSEMMSDTVGTLEWIWFPKMDAEANTH